MRDRAAEWPSSDESMWCPDRAWLRRALLLLGLALLPAPGQAQSPAERTALQALRDSLTAVTDQAALLALEERTIEVARRDRDNPMLHLRLGLIAWRLAALGSKPHSDHAQGEFEWALELRPDWPWPRFGLGLVLEQRPDRTGKYAGGLVAMLGIDEPTQALRAYRGAVRSDSSFVDAVIGLGKVSLDRRRSGDDAEVLRALRSTAARYPTPMLLLAWAELERRKGSADSALVALVELRDSIGPTPRVLLELARTIPLVAPSRATRLGLPTTESVYFQGLSEGDATIQRMYRDDLQPIVSDTVLAEFDARQGADRVTWLQDFWRERDALALRAPGERLAEHFRRWAYVLTNYRLQPGIRRHATGIEAPPPADIRDIDDRGRVYLRHGVPVNRLPYPMFLEYGPRTPGMISAASIVRLDANGRRVVEPPLPFYQPPKTGGRSYGSETWLYQQPEGDMVLHFAAHYDPFDYRLQYTVFTLPTIFADYTIRGSTIRGALTDDPFGDPGKVAEELGRGREANRTATTTDSWTRVYRTMLGTKAHWFIAGDSAGHPLAHLIYVIDAVALRSRPGPLVPVTVRLAFADAEGHLLRRIDTIPTLMRPGPMARGASFHLKFTLPPGTVTTRLATELSPDIGAMHRSDTLVLPRLDGPGMVLSDLLIGRAGRSNVWRTTRGGVVPIDPRDMRYVPDDSLEIYAEVHGVQPDRPYAVSVAIRREVGGLRRLFGGQGEAVMIRQQVTFDRSTGVVARTIPLTELRPGTYRMTLTVSGEGREVSTVREVVVMAPE